MALKAIEPFRKDAAACAIYGAISFGERGREPKPLSGKLAVRGICETEDARGGRLGNGVLFSSPKRNGRGKNVCVWAREQPFVDEIASTLKGEGIATTRFARAGQGDIYMAKTAAEYFPLLFAVAKANAAFALEQARIISFGHGTELYKGLESLSVLDKVYGLSEMFADAMLAHTRYPTGSGPLIVRAHPFSFGNVAIVHNGDLTSYMANLNACLGKLAELYHRHTGKDPEAFYHDQLKSLVGTDSEMMAVMLYTLLKIGRETDIQLSMRDILSILVPRFENQLTWLPRGSDERTRLERLASDYQGFGMDGPVSCLALITGEDSVNMLAFRDRNEFRPLEVVVDHRKNVAYAASELRQIIASTGLNIFSREVESYPLEPGGVLWVNSRTGIQKGWEGRKKRPYIAVPEFKEGPPVIMIEGAPSQFAGQKIDGHCRCEGILGVHGGFLSHGKGTFELKGSMAPNVFEGSQLDTVICHANTSTDLAAKFQGRVFFVRSSVDARAFAQMRSPPPHPSELAGMSVENPEHVKRMEEMLRNGRIPVAIIGETAGQNLGRMNSSGIIMVLGLDNLGKEGVDAPIVGHGLMTGAVGGEAYIRGDVPDEFIGLSPQRRDVIEVCKLLEDDGVLNQTAMRRIRKKTLNFERVVEIIKESQNGAPAEVNATNLEIARASLSKLYGNRLIVERRQLTPDEKEKLAPYLGEYCATFNLNNHTVEKLLASNYTVVKVRPAEAAPAAAESAAAAVLN